MTKLKHLTASKTTVVGADLAAVLPTSDKHWIRQPHLLKLNAYLFIALLSAVNLGFDGSMMNGLLSLESWNREFGTPRGSLLGITNAVLPLGVLLAAFPAGWVSDRFGRKKCIAVGGVLAVSAAIMQGAAQNMATFILSRFFIGFGVEFLIMPAPVLITEVAYPTHRGKFTAFYNSFFYLGAIVASWVTFGTFPMAQSSWAWRIPSLLQIFFPLIQLVGIHFVPESPRWLISKGRHDEARAMLVKYHAAGDEHSPLVDFQMREMIASINEAAEANTVGWAALWTSKADKRRLTIVLLVPFISHWAGNGVISWYLSLVLTSIGITDSFTQTWINGVLQIFNLFAAMIAAFLVDRLGRRTLWLWSCLGMLFSYIAWTACAALNLEFGNSTAGYFVVVFIFIYFFHYDIGVTIFAWSYPAEILPYHNRSKGMAIVNFCNGLALMFNSFVNPIALADIGWKYYIVYCVLLVVITTVVYLFFPETRGHSLEEIAEVFEGNKRAWGNSRKRKSNVNMTESMPKTDDKNTTRVETVEQI